MRYSATILLAAATASLAQSTSDIPSYKSSLDMKIQANSVEESTKYAWCNAQYNTCRTLCDGDTKSNACETSDLSFDCKCTSNSSAPGLQYYTQTMPTFICQTAFSQCIENHSTQRDHDLCTKNIDDKCATLDPPSPKKGSSNNDDKDDDDSDDDENSSSTTSASATESSSTNTADSNSASSTESDDLAAATMIPGGAAAVAAIGVLAYLV